MYSTEQFECRRFESDGCIEIKGQKITYHTISEDNPFYDNEGRISASIFSYSYFRTDIQDVKSRPVIFAFNGGPGSSCMMVHVGFLGTKRIVYGDCNNPTTLPPYTVIDNPNCMLDVADLVLIDPVGCGYGVLVDEEKGKDFFGIEEDAESILLFIEKWLTKYNRWGSPKYLVGESYGCTRAAAVAGLASGWTRDKERSYNFAFDGIVFIGNTVTVGKYFNKEVPVEPSVLGFPTYAAINWYHNRPTKQELDEFVSEAWEFAKNDYLLALFEGESLAGKEREDIENKICYYTGVSKEYLEKRDLKIEAISFRSEVLKNRGLAVSRYDARITRPLYEPYIVEERRGGPTDATAGKYNPYFLSGLLGTLLPSIGIKDFDRSFITSRSMQKKWNNETTDLSTAEMLGNAMLRCPGMRVFFANGLFDIATEIGIVYYTVTHAHFPMDRVSVKGYPSGHMIYIGEENIESLTEDIRSFLAGERVE